MLLERVAFMSLRPAQALVAESSKFSLRTFFESSSPSPASSMDAISEGLPTLNASMQPSSSSQMMMMAMPPSETEHPPSPTSAPHPHPHPLAAAGPLRPTSAPAASPGKFTFNGLMPTTTPAQLQHKLLQQHQHAAIQSGLAGANRIGATPSDPNEVLRLKAQVLSLTDRANQLNANLASTSESVVRGNKALTTERAQFHAKFSGLSRKLEATQSALAEAEALPVEAAKSAKLLNAKILELQAENHQLTQTRAALEATIEARAGEVAALHEASETAVGTQATLQAQCDELTSKYATLAKQHSMVLARQEELTEELQEHQGLLIDAEARAEDAIGQLEASRIEAATADQLVDKLDAKLAEARIAAPTGCDECGGCKDPKNAMDDAMEEEAMEEAMEEGEEGEREAAETGEAAGEETWTIAEREAAIQAPAVEASLLEVAEAPVSCCCPKTMRCEALEKLAMEAHGKMHCAEEADCERLAEEHRFADSMAKRARWSLTNEVEERVVVAHVYTDTESCMDDSVCCLGATIRDNPLTVARPFEESFRLVRVGAATADAAEGGATDRTNAFVNAVSQDLKFHMDDSQKLYKTSSTTGAALKI